MKTVAVFLIIAITSPLHAADPSKADAIPLRVVNGDAEFSSRNCGLYCVYQAAKIAGRDVPLEFLFREDRLNGKWGSTLADLETACRDLSIPHYTIPSCSYCDVCFIGQPVIVLIRKNPQSPEANHWVMILEARPGLARVYEPSMGVIEIPEHELQELWSGLAIAIPIDPGEAGSKAEWAAGKTVLIAALLGFTFLILKATSFLRFPAIVGLLATAGVLAAVADAVSPTGFFRCPDSVECRLTPAEPRLIQEVDMSAVRMNLEGFVFIDVRTKGQFDYEHLPGAVNVPIDATYWRNRAVLASIPSDKPLVLYCNNKECGWAEMMAKSALFRRFPDVRVFRGGRDVYRMFGGRTVRGPDFEVAGP